jgi:hypothetical protein
MARGNRYKKGLTGGEIFVITLAGGIFVAALVVLIVFLRKMNKPAAITSSAAPAESETESALDASEETSLPEATAELAQIEDGGAKALEETGIVLDNGAWLYANAHNPKLDFDGPVPFRVEVVAKLDDRGVIAGSYREGSTSGWYMLVDVDDMLHFVRPGGNPGRAISHAPVAIGDGTVRRYAMSYDGDTLRGYVDDQLVTTEVYMPTNLIAQDGPVFVGAGRMFQSMDYFCSGTYYSFTAYSVAEPTSADHIVAQYDFSRKDAEGHFVNLVDPENYLTYTNVSLEREKLLRLIEEENPFAAKL